MRYLKQYESHNSDIVYVGAIDVQFKGETKLIDDTISKDNIIKYNNKIEKLIDFDIQPSLQKEYPKLFFYKKPYQLICDVHGIITFTIVKDSDDYYYVCSVEFSDNLDYGAYRCDGYDALIRFINMILSFNNATIFDYLNNKLK